MTRLSQLDAHIAEQAGTVSAASTGTTITASASTNTKGAYTQLIAATTYATSWALVQMGNVSAAARKWLVDIAIGAAASEVVLLPNLLFEAKTSSDSQASMLFPVAIPAGARVAARCQSANASTQIDVSILLIAGPPVFPGGLHSVVDYGTVTATSRGTNIDAGGTANTKSGWSQLSASTTKPIRWLVVAVANPNNNIAATTNYLTDIGIGAAASEQVIVANLYSVTGSNSDMPQPSVFSFPCSIPQGARLAARIQASNNTSTDRTLDVIVWGVG